MGRASRPALVHCPGAPRTRAEGAGAQPQGGEVDVVGAGVPKRSSNSVPEWQIQQLLRPAMSVGSGAVLPWQAMQG
jgi:hypothetical protein